MAHKPETRDKVRRLYIFERQSLEMAALQAGVPFASASRWKREAKKAGDDWDKMRAAAILADGSVEDVARAALSGFMMQYSSTMEMLNTNAEITPEARVKLLASLADSFNKTVSASKRVLPETSQLATAMEVLQKMAKFIRERHPKHAAAFVEILEPFGDELTKSYG